MKNYKNRCWIYEIRNKTFKVIDQIYEDWFYEEFLKESIKILNEHWSNNHLRPISFKDYETILIRKNFLFKEISRIYVHSEWLFESKHIKYSEYIDLLWEKNNFYFIKSKTINWNEQLYSLRHKFIKEHKTIKEFLVDIKNYLNKLTNFIFLKQ